MGLCFSRDALEVRYKDPETSGFIADKVLHLTDHFLSSILKSEKPMTRGVAL